jgi:hypothetical protein
VISTNAAGARSVYATDVNGDGDTDVLSASWSDNKIAWYESDGGSPPGFTEHVISASAAGARSVYATDVDGDGDTDVLSASQDDDTIAWYENPMGSTSLSAGAALVADGALINGGPLTVLAATVSSGGPLTNDGLLRLLDGVVEAGSGLTNATGTIEGYGDIAADLTNDGGATFFGDTYVIGDCTNTSRIVIQNGTLTILGTLTNNGQIIGDLFGGGAAAGASAGIDGFFVQGTFTAAPTASLLMASEAAVVRIGGAYDVAIDDNRHYHMAQAELRLVGLSNQTLELMSTDIGPDEAGLDRTLPGHFPVGTLRIGPTPTTVNMVDSHDNDGLGQGLCEAIYVQDLVIEAGAVLNTLGCPVYYVTAQIDGEVDDPENLIQLPPPCPADCALPPDGVVNVVDFLALLADWGGTGPCDCADGGDGTVNVVDFLAMLANWGPCH